MTIYAMEKGCLEDIKSLMSKIKFKASDNIQASAIGATPMKVEGGVASIDVVGVLEPTRNKIYDWWGIKQTAYSDIVEQVALAESDPRVKKTVYNINSGGGNYTGLIPVMDAIYSAKKPSTARVTGMAASAAYMIASQVDTIETESEGDLIGSVGTVSTFAIYENIKEITNRDSRDKRPDVTTDHGKSVVEDMLDDIQETVATRIARGQNVSLDTVKNDYGKGAVMTSGKAKELGMIDSVGFSDASNNIMKNINNKTKTSGISGQEKECKMETLTLAELKAQHPDLYASCFNTGVEAGNKEYQQLACNHLELAAMSGAMDKAVEDIKAGNEVTPAVATYHSIQGVKKAQIDARSGEAPDEIGEGESPVDAAHNDDNKKEVEEAHATFAKLGVEVE
jgi:ClpP class serine protease